MSDNRSQLIQTIQALPLLDGRYENIKCVNFDPVAVAKRGCFSIVFRAHDVLENRDVALKFFDIDPSNLVRIYRRQAFEREHQLLQELQSRDRCLQLTAGRSVFNLSGTGPGGAGLTIPCEYFAVEWIDDQVDEYFERQQDFSAIDKLNLFNEIVLAVQALHRQNVFHRDLKPDNLRSYQKNSKRVVVAIDLGTAALCSSAAIQPDYVHPVGAPAYSPLEAFCHLAGERDVAFCADHYALGCMLYQLFNFDLFARAYLNRNPHYHFVLAAMEHLLRGAPTVEEKVRRWRQHIGSNSSGLSCPPIDGVGSSLPKGVAPLLNPLLVALTMPDFSKRTKDLDRVRRTIWSAIRSLENEQDYQRRLKAMRDRRKRREEKARQRDERLNRLITEA
jgi:serine/threonine protein kinase